MNLQPLLEWQNLVFILSMAFALIMLIISILGGASDSDHDHDIDHDVDHDFDGHAHAVDFDDTSILDKALSAFGIGRVPLSILALCWCMIFGFVGLFLNTYALTELVTTTMLRFIISASIALVSSVVATAFLARLIGKIMPKVESYAEKRQEFINREAEVLYSITASSGTVTMRDKYGNYQQFPAFLDNRWNQPILPGTKVVLLSYDDQALTFKVIPVSELKLLETNNS